MSHERDIHDDGAPKRAGMLVDMGMDAKWNALEKHFMEMEPNGREPDRHTLEQLGKAYKMLGFDAEKV